MMTWQEASQLPEYKSLPEMDKIRAKMEYFNASINETGVPPELIPQAKKEFLEFTKEVPEKTSFTKEFITPTLKGAGETALSVGSGMGAGLLSGLGYAVSKPLEAVGVVPKGFPEGYMEAIQEKLTYQPQTEAGERGVAAVSYPFAKLDKLAAEQGDMTFELTGDPIQAAMKSTAIKFLPFLIEKRGAYPTKTTIKAGIKSISKGQSTVTGKTIPTSPISDVPAYKRAGVKINAEQLPPDLVPSGQTMEGLKAKILNSIEKRRKGIELTSEETQLSGLFEEKLGEYKARMQPPKPKELPAPDTIYGDNFTAISPEKAPKPQQPYAGQKLLSPPNIEVTPKGEAITPKAQSILAQESEMNYIKIAKDMREATNIRIGLKKKYGISSETRKIGNIIYVKIKKPDMELLKQAEQLPPDLKPQVTEPIKPPEPQKTLKEIRIIDDKEVPVYDTKQVQIDKIPPELQQPEPILHDNKVITPIKTSAKPKEAWEMTRDELKNWEFPVPEGGASKTPKTVFNWQKGVDFESLAEVTDEFRLNEIFGIDKRMKFGIKPSIKEKVLAKHNKPLTIYRVVEKGSGQDIIPGAYVTESLEYAKRHGDTILKKQMGLDYEIKKSMVMPSELLVYGDPHEFIYVPDSIEGYHKTKIRQALSEGKPVPAEVLKDYPELQQVKPIPETPTKQVKPVLHEDKGVTPKKVINIIEKAQDKTSLSLKESKTYLINEIDRAIEQAPDEIEISYKGYNKPVDLTKTNHVKIDVPGDGIFRVVNDKKSLRQFRNMVNKGLKEGSGRLPKVDTVTNKTMPIKEWDEHLSYYDKPKDAKITNKEFKNITDADIYDAPNEVLKKVLEDKAIYLPKNKKLREKIQNKLKDRDVSSESGAASLDQLVPSLEVLSKPIHPKESVERTIPDIEITAKRGTETGHWIDVTDKADKLVRLNEEAIDSINQMKSDILNGVNFKTVIKDIPAQLRKTIKTDIKDFKKQGMTTKEAQQKAIDELGKIYEKEREGIQSQIKPEVKAGGGEGEKGSISLDIITPELPSQEKAGRYGYIGAVANQETQDIGKPEGDKKSDFATRQVEYHKQMDDVINSAFDWIKDYSKTELDRMGKIARGEASKEETEKEISNAIFGAVGMGTPLKSAISSQAPKLGRIIANKVKDVLGITPANLKKAYDLNGVSESFIIPDTVSRKYGNKYPAIRNIVDEMFKRSEETGAGIHLDARVFKHFNNIPKTDRMAGLDVYIKSAAQEGLDNGYSKLSLAGKRAFHIIKQPLDSIREDIVVTAQKDMIEMINVSNITDDLKEVAIKGINTLNDRLVPDYLKTNIEILKTYGKRAFYLPEVRQGKWSVGLQELTNDITIFDAGFKSQSEAGDFKAFLDKAVDEGDYSVVADWFRKSGRSIPQGMIDAFKSGKVVTYARPLTKVTYEASKDMPMAKTYSVIKSLAEKAGSKKDFLNAVTEDYLNWFKERGFNQHFIQRKGVAGWSLESDDVIDSVSDYIKGYYMMRAKKNAAKTVFENWGDIAVKKTVPPELVKWTNRYIDYVFGSPETTGDIASGISKYFLWGRAKSMMVNATQNATSGMASYIHNGINPLNMTKAMFDITAKRLSITDKKAITSLLKTGQGQSMIFEEIAGHIQKGKVSDLGMLPFQFAETYVNRIPNYLGAFRHFYRQSKNLAEASEKAIKVMNEGHYWASRFNRNEISRGNLNRMLTALTTFTQHYIKQVNHYAGEKDYKALAYLLASPVVLGGMAAVPAGEVTLLASKRAYKGLTGRELSLDIEKVPNQTIQSLVKGGVLGTIGLRGLSQSMGIGVSPSPERNIPLTTIIQRIYKAEEAVKRGDYDRAVENLLPSAGQDVMGTIREYREGVSTSTGTPITDEKGKQIKLTGNEALKNLIGITPARKLKFRDIATINREIVDERENVMTKFRTRFLDADTFSEKKEIVKELENHNKILKGKIDKEKDNREKKRLYMLRISKKDFFRSVKGKEKGMERIMGGERGMRLYRELAGVNP